MPQIQLTPAERRLHRADAHHLDPVVLIGGDGLTPAVKKEVDAALNAHGLIKVRVFGDDRAARELMYQELAAELNAAPIQHIGKLLVLWRPVTPKERAVDEDRMPGPRDVKVLNKVIASSDIVAADAYATTLFGLKPEDISTTVAAYRRGLGEMNLSRIRLLKA